MKNNNLRSANRSSQSKNKTGYEKESAPPGPHYLRILMILLVLGIVCVIRGPVGAENDSESQPPEPQDILAEVEKALEGETTEPDDMLVEVEKALETEIMVQALPEDGPSFEVSRFVIEYQPADHPGHPAIEELMQLDVELTMVADGYVAPREGAELVTIRPGEISDHPIRRFYASGLLAVAQRFVKHLNEEGIIGIYIAVAESDLEVLVDPETGAQTFTDLRTEEQKKALRPVEMVIWTGVITELRTVASGERIPREERLDHPDHVRIKVHSPVQPFEEGQIERNDLMRKDLLDDYIFRLNRHPGRKVDMAISSAEQPGEVALDFLVTENKPWLVYAQISNTGTEETEEWRERFGFSHNQLTGNDDILTIDYVTAGFDESHSVLGAYEAPFFDTEGMRWRVYGIWGEFDASEVGLANENFFGEEWAVGGEISKNVYQYHELFVDVFAGARWRNLSVENFITDIGQKTVLADGETDFFLPVLGTRLERYTGTSRSFGQLDLEWSCPAIAGTDEDEVNKLGRVDVEDDWMALKWDLRHAFFLEPILNREAWEDVETPESSTLAHEVALNIRGQHAFGDRLIPHALGVVGGLYSVRGYPESIANGDSMLIGNAEYMYHIPKAFEIQNTPGRFFDRPFRWAPQQLYGRPDWDLILRAFFDYGRTQINDKVTFEEEHNLMGTGIGIELQFTRNLSVRVDWGFALEGVRSSDEDVSSGENRVHVVGTIVY